MNKTKGNHYKEKDKRKRLLIIIIFILSLIILIFTTLFFFFFWYLRPRPDNAIFKQIPVDKYTERFSNDKSNMKDFDLSSFEFNSEITFVNGEAIINLKNLTNATQSAIAQLQITDAELKNVNGGTGRTDIFQAELEKQHGYDPNNSRVTIAQSGQIPPGTSLKKMVLSTLPNGTSLKKGTYNGILFLDFLSDETSEKSFINTQFAVKIIIK